MIRALYWLALNEPAGIDYRMHGAKLVKVEGTLEDGTKVARLWSNTKNDYAVTTPDGDTSVWEKVGRNVPAEVSALLGLRPLNFHLQHDGPFLIGLRSAEAGRAVNELVDLSLIDSSLKHLTAGLRASKTDTEALTRDLAAAQGERDRLEAMDLSAREAQLRMLEGQVAEANRMAGQCTKLVSIIDGLAHEAATNRQAIRLRCANATLDGLLTRIGHRLSSQLRINRLIELGKAISAASAAAAVGTRMSSAESCLTLIDGHLARLASTAWKITTLDQALKTIVDIATKAKADEQEAERLLTLAPSLCPTCGASLSE